ncbi:MAG: nucleotidyltransferase domain-containing protein, partial [Gemmatimonadaceae bacterium]|nr:nucleotidyltransferase domain-containing protein [Gemmatimonadaceae bacterium]
MPARHSRALESDALDALSPTLRSVADVLRASAGVVALVLGGSRALDRAESGSDWDLVLYYRGAIDLGPLATLGEVHAPGTWGRLMNGGAWLTVDGISVDVMLRDLDVALHWSAAAARGRYELDA